MRPKCTPQELAQYESDLALKYAGYIPEQNHHTRLRAAASAPTATAIRGMSPAASTMNCVPAAIDEAVVTLRKHLYVSIGSVHLYRAKRDQFDISVGTRDNHIDPNGNFWQPGDKEGCLVRVERIGRFYVRVILISYLSPADTWIYLLTCYRLKTRLTSILSPLLVVLLKIMLAVATPLSQKETRAPTNTQSVVCLVLMMLGGSYNGRLSSLILTLHFYSLPFVRRTWAGCHVDNGRCQVGDTICARQGHCRADGVLTRALLAQAHTPLS